MASAWHRRHEDGRYGWGRGGSPDGRVRQAEGGPSVERIPEPVGPSDEERRQHLSDTHCRTWIRDGILARDLDEAISIVEAFGGRRSMPISLDVAERMNRSEQGIAVVLTALAENALQSGSDRFLDQVVADIRQQTARKGSFWKGWDYDGHGAFQKATIRVMPEGSGWVVRISVAHRNVEPSLARDLGLPMRFLRARHHVTYRTEGDLFSIPVRQIMQAARIAGSENPPSPKAILDAMRTPTGDSDYGEAILHEDGSTIVSIRFDETRIPQSFEMKRIANDAGLKTVPDDWTPHLAGGEGEERIEGLARTWRSWPDPWASGIEIMIAPRDSHDPEHERRCIEISNDVARLWAGLPGAYREGDA